MATVADNSERLISCSFCDEKNPPSTIGHHLMMCGNKTDQCPNCRKYIRRAVFAYHYENTCANLDEPDADVRPAVNQPATSSGSPTENNKEISLMEFDPAPHPNPQSTTSQRSNSDFVESKKITAVCRYCNNKCEIRELNMHEERCLKNPTNINNRERSRNNPTSIQNPDRVNHLDELNGTAEIPCEYCNQPIRMIDFYNHSNACAARYRQRIQEQSQSANWMNHNVMVRCRYCNLDYVASVVQQHEMNCYQNPAKAASEGRFANFWRRLPIPPIHMGFF